MRSVVSLSLVLSGVWLASGCSGPQPATDKITAADFEAHVIKSDVPVLVDFGADWCGPCRMVEPILHRLEEEFAGKLTLYPVDVDENPNLSSEYGAYRIPEIILFANGEIVSTYAGGLSESELRRWLETHLDLAAQEQNEAPVDGEPSDDSHETEASDSTVGD